MTDREKTSATQAIYELALEKLIELGQFPPEADKARALMAAIDQYLGDPDE